MTIKAEDRGNIEDEARALHEQMCADLVVNGVDPEVAFVTFIDIGEGMSQVLEQGPLLKCIIAALELITDNEDATPYTAPLDEYMETVKSEATIN